MFFSDRAKLIGITIGTGVALHLVFGTVLGLTFPYLLLTMIYTAVGFVTLQVYLKNGEDAVCDLTEFFTDFLKVLVDLQAMLQPRFFTCYESK